MCAFASVEHRRVGRKRQGTSAHRRKIVERDTEGYLEAQERGCRSSPLPFLLPMSHTSRRVLLRPRESQAEDVVVVEVDFVVAVVIERIARIRWPNVLAAETCLEAGEVSQVGRSRKRNGIEPKRGISNPRLLVATRWEHAYPDGPDAIEGSVAVHEWHTRFDI